MPWITLAFLPYFITLITVATRKESEPLTGAVDRSLGYFAWPAVACITTKLIIDVAIYFAAPFLMHHGPETLGVLCILLPGVTACLCFAPLLWRNWQQHVSTNLRIIVLIWTTVWAILSYVSLHEPVWLISSAKDFYHFFFPWHILMIIALATTLTLKARNRFDQLVPDRGAARGPSMHPLLLPIACLLLSATFYSYRGYKDYWVAQEQNIIGQSTNPFGIRDTVNEFIQHRFNLPNQRIAARIYADYLQKAMLLKLDEDSAAVKFSYKHRGLVCFRAVFKDNFQSELEVLNKVVLDTYERARAFDNYRKALGGLLFMVGSPSEEECTRTPRA